ncbi:MAG: CBS domain-containing protein [Kofleriaceae bacterium]
MKRANAGQMMRDHRFGCLPVIDAEHRLLAIVTEREFLDFAIKAIAMHD